jgi:hypothetical protein
MGKTLGTLEFDDCTLAWERELATLAGKPGKGPIEFVLTDGSIREKPLAKGTDRAVLDCGANALLADGDGYSLVLVQVGKPVLAGFLAGGRAVLVAREEVRLHAFGNPNPIARVSSDGGALQHDLADSKGDVAAVPGQRRVYVVDAEAGSIRASEDLEKKITGLSIAAGKVTVKLGAKGKAVFDRAGNRVV